MFGFLKSLFGGTKVNYKELVTNGAIILDVRTTGEYRGGNIKGSVNIPLQNLNQQLSKLDKTKPIITCCASGMRSASAKTILQANGFAQVYNGGGWSSLQYQLK